MPPAEPHINPFVAELGQNKRKSERRGSVGVAIHLIVQKAISI